MINTRNRDKLAFALSFGASLTQLVHSRVNDTSTRSMVLESLANESTVSRARIGEIMAPGSTTPPVTLIEALWLLQALGVPYKPILDTVKASARIAELAASEPRK